MNEILKARKKAILRADNEWAERIRQGDKKMSKNNGIFWVLTILLFVLFALLSLLFLELNDKKVNIIEVPDVHYHITNPTIFKNYTYEPVTKKISDCVLVRWVDSNGQKRAECFEEK